MAVVGWPVRYWNQRARRWCLVLVWADSAEQALERAKVMFSGRKVEPVGMTRRVVESQERAP